jgi:hypothetical protein
MLRRCNALTVSFKGSRPSLLRRAAVAVMVVCAFAVVAHPAYAAPPENDTPSGATLIDALPFTDSVAIDEATTDALEVMLADQCLALAPEGSVWYRYEASQDGALVFDASILDTSGSSVPARLIVTAGDPAEGSVVACGGETPVGVTAGQTYFIMAFSDTGVTTGTLVFHADVAPPPPEVDVTVDLAGTFDSKTGSATISGTVQCSGAEAVFIDVTVNQNVGRLFTISGLGTDDALCTGTPQPWSVEVLPMSGKFKGGTAMSSTSAFACTDFDCGSDFEQTTVRLRGH